MGKYDEYASREFEKNVSDLLAASPLVLVETQDALTVRNDGGSVYEIDSPTPHDRAMARRVVTSVNNHEKLLDGFRAIAEWAAILSLWYNQETNLRREVEDAITDINAIVQAALKVVKGDVEHESRDGEGHRPVD